MRHSNARSQVAVLRARQALLMFGLSFATYCLFVQIMKSFLE